MNKNLPPLSERLGEVLKYIEKGDVVADIGTDHAYLPIYLLVSGTVDKAYASDVNEGPCMRARENAGKYGLGEDKIIISKRDGIKGLGNAGIDKLVICGMGGELIADILGGEEMPNGTRFVLNPMTRQERLRRFLKENGYAILDESCVRSDGKIYQMIYCEYTGRMTKDTVSQFEYKFGKINLEKKEDIFIEYMEKTLGELTLAKTARDAAGVASEDDRIIEDILDYLEYIKESKGE